MNTLQPGAAGRTMPKVPADPLKLDEEAIAEAIGEWSQLPAAIANGLPFTMKIQRALFDHLSPRRDEEAAR